MSDSNSIKTESHISVDVVIPVFNGERFITQAISTVIEQSYLPEKIVVVDDGSTDKTPELIKNLKSHVQIIYVRKENGGLSSARNMGISRCTSNYIAFLDADDEWYPDKLAEQVRLIRESSMTDLGVVYCRYTIIDENGQEDIKCPISEPDIRVRGRVFKLLLEGNKISSSGSGVIVKRSCFEKAGVFDETLLACEDWDMWLRLSELYDFDFVFKKLVKIRRHTSNMQKDSTHMLINQLKFYDKWLKKTSTDLKYISKWRRRILYYFVDEFLNVDVIGLTKKNIYVEGRQKLFSTTLGLIELYIIVSLPIILYRLTLKLIAASSRCIRTILGEFN